MSHTYKTENGTRFIYNSDLSGTVLIIKPNVEDDLPGEFRILGQDFISFTLTWIRERYLIPFLNEVGWDFLPQKEI